MAAPRFGQAPRCAIVEITDALVTPLLTGDIAAGIRVEAIRFYTFAGTTAGQLLVLLGDGVDTRIIDEIDINVGDMTARRYDWLVLPDTWVLSVQHPALAAGSLDVSLYGAELG